MTAIGCARALGYLKAGWTITQVAKELGRHKLAISRLAKKDREMREERAMVKTPGGSRKNFTSLEDIRKILRLVQKRPFISAKSILGEEGDKFSVTRFSKRLGTSQGMLQASLFSQRG